MLRVLVLLVLTCSINGSCSGANDSDMYLRGGGGGMREGQSSLRQIAARGNPQPRIEVINLRGQMEAQNIDTGDRGGWWRCLIDSLSRWCSNMCGSRPQPLTPTERERPPLTRTYSVYPGR